MLVQHSGPMADETSANRSMKVEEELQRPQHVRDLFRCHDPVSATMSQLTTAHSITVGTLA